MHLAHEVVGLQHSPHAVGKAQRHGHGQSFGNRHHKQCDGNHYRLQEERDKSKPVKLHHVDEEERQPSNDNQGRDAEAYSRYESAEPVELLIERGLYTVVDLCRLKHFSVLGVVAHSLYLIHSMPFHDLGTAHNPIGRESGILVKESRVGRLGAHGLTRQRRLVDLERNSLDQLSVGGNLLTGGNDNYITHNDVLLGHLSSVAVANHLDGLIVINLVEDCKLLVGPCFKVEGKPGGKEYGDENAKRLKEHRSVGIGQCVILVARNAYRERTGNKKDYYQRVLEFLEKSHEHRSLFGRSKYIYTMLTPAFQNLSIGQAIIMTRL